MSFTKNLKAQLCKTENSCRLCDIAELSSIVRLCTTYRGDGVIFSTENEDVAERFGILFERVFKKQLDYVNRNGNFRADIDFDFFTGEMAERLCLFEAANKNLTPRECCRGAYLRGAFLGGGSMLNPKTRYHMEFDSKHEGNAERICALLKRKGIAAKITKRKGRYVVYIKEYAAIADALGAMGAVSAAMELYNVSIEKELRNTANRQANCEIANIEKTTRTAVSQIEAIKKIEKYIGFDELPETLREIADLRCRYPDESLKELGERLNPPIGKSGVNHRLKRIEAIAETL